MEKKLLNQKLLKSIINSDFLFIEVQKLREKQLFSTVNSSTINGQSIILLDALEVIKELKQLIRIFFYLKKNSTKLKLNFFFGDDNNIMGPLIQKFFQHPIILKYLDFEINSHKKPRVKLLNSKNFSNFSFMFENFSNKNFVKKELRKKNRLFLKINTDAQLESYTYKIHNNFNDYKKSIFFLTFLRQIILTLYINPRYEISKKI